MRNITDIKADITAKRRELESLESELQNVREQRDNSERDALNKTYAGKWIRVYGREWSHGLSIVNPNKVTMAKIKDIDTVMCDGEIDCIATRYRFYFNDESISPLIPNDNAFAAKYCDTRYAFYAKDAEIMDDTTAEQLLTEYRRRVIDIVDITGMFAKEK